MARQKFHLPDALVQIANILPHSVAGALRLAGQRPQFVQVPIIQSPQAGELAGFAVGPVQAAKPDDRLSLTRWIPPSRIQDSVADSLRSVSLAQGFEPHRSGFVWRLQNRVFAVEPHRVALFLHRPDKLPPGQRTVDRIVHILSDEAAPG